MMEQATTSHSATATDNAPDTATTTAPDTGTTIPSGPENPISDEAISGPRQTSTARSNTYGSFLIETTEFALPVDMVQEVVNEPAGYVPVPVSPPHFLGLFNLRGMIIPVIDLSILLGFPTPADKDSRLIAIIESGDLCIGLLFDQIGGIVNSDGAAHVTFEARSDDLTDTVIEGVLKLDNGNRLVQLLNPYRLLNLDRVPRTKKRKFVASAKDSMGPRQSCISFQVGHTQCAINLSYIQEITDAPDLQASHLASGNLIGNFELRGRTIPIIDFRGFFGSEPAYDFAGKSLNPRKLLVLNLADGPIGLMVYTIDSIMPYYQTEVLPFANVALPRHDIIEGCLVNDDEDIVILLDSESLIQDKYLLDAAKSCNEIYPPKTNESAKAQEAQKSTRKSFILFTVEKPFAIDISCVSEIINRPDNVLKPPYALDFVEGIIHLREELITLFNPRALYNFAPSDKPSEKVLILQSRGKKYGMIVDSVNEVLNMTNSKFFDMPHVHRKDALQDVSEDVVGYLNIPSRGLRSDPAMVLNVDAFLARCVSIN